MDDRGGLGGLRNLIIFFRSKGGYTNFTNFICKGTINANILKSYLLDYK